MAELNFTCGRLLCGAVRKYLRKVSFRYPEVRWMESSGWIKRDFQIIGSEDKVRNVYTDLKSWSKRLEETDE
jgi:hypothetical protein